MKKYIIDEEQRAEVLRLMRARSYHGAANLLDQLEELKEDQSLKSELDRNANKKGRAAQRPVNRESRIPPYPS